jgi:hypothetical protein
LNPKRVQLSRKKGWKMPENTVKVDRTTQWGNPFIVGKHGTRAECVRLFELLLGGLFCVSAKNLEAQVEYVAMAARDREQLRGKNLACWCPPDAPCHADVLLMLSNAKVCASVTAAAELPGSAASEGN